MNKKYKVLIITNRFTIGGPAFVVTNLVNHLTPEFDVKLLSGMLADQEVEFTELLNQLKEKPIYIPNMKRSLSNPFSDFKAYRHIRKIIKEYKPDIVHTHASKPGTLGRLAAKHEGVPVIIHTYHGHYFHSYFGKAKTKLLIAIDKYLAKLSSKILTISERQLEDILEVGIVENDKIESIPLGFSFDRFVTNQEEKRAAFRAEFNLTDDEIAIGIIGRLVPVKNHNYFIDVVQKLNESSNGKKVKAFIIGDGEERESIEEYAKQEGLSFATEHDSDKNKPLIFTSWRSDMDVIINGLDIIALTSNNEGTPVVLIEAQAAGKPIVTTDVGGIRDCVIEDKTAFLSSPGDIDQFVTNLTKLINDKELRVAMGKDAQQYATEKYHYTSFIQNMKEVYYNLLNQGDADISN